MILILSLKCVHLLTETSGDDTCRGVAVVLTVVRLLRIVEVMLPTGPSSGCSSPGWSPECPCTGLVSILPHAGTSGPAIGCSLGAMGLRLFLRHRVLAGRSRWMSSASLQLTGDAAAPIVSLRGM